MAHVELKHFSTQVCGLCGKGDTMGSNKPHSLHSTKRVVKPNLQKKWGVTLCNNCFRTLKKHNIEIKPEAKTSEEKKTA